MSGEGVFLLIAAAVGVPLLTAIAVESWRLHRAHRRLLRDLTTAAAQHAWDSTTDHTDHSNEGDKTNGN